MRRTGGHAGTTHDAGINIIILKYGRTLGKGHLTDRWLHFIIIARSRREPWGDILNFSPKRGHVHDQIFDHRQIPQRGIDVRQASFSVPLISMAYDPQIADQQEYLSDNVPSC